MKKLAALLLIAALALSLLAGCTPAAEPEPSPTDSAPGATDSGGDAAETLAIDYDAAYAAFAPETVMITVNGREILWEELFFYLWSYSKSLTQYVGTVTDWETLVEAPDYTYRDYVMEGAAYGAISNLVLEYGAELLGADFTAEDEAAVQADVDALKVQAGAETEEAYVEFLRQQYCTPAVVEVMARAEQIANKCFEIMYGAEGEKLSDGDIAEYTEDSYYTAKHILCKTVQDDRTTPLSEEEIAAAHEKIQGILDELNAASPEEFDALFQRLMEENSEDPGAVSYPDGYLFQEGNMTAEFFSGVKALEIGEHSGIVESSDGYHIIYRLPVNADLVPIATTTGSTLRRDVAWGMFGAVAERWEQDCEIVYSDNYSKIDLAALFKAV